MQAVCAVVVPVPLYLRLMKAMKVIDDELIEGLVRRAEASERLRMNHNFHDTDRAPVHRLLNAMQRGTFVPVHRHLALPKDESVVILRGRAASFVFDDTGNIVQQTVVDPREGVYGFEIAAGTWHGLLVLEDGTVLYEVKQGPYAPLSAEDIAPWSPDPADREAVAGFLEDLEKRIGR